MSEEYWVWDKIAEQWNGNIFYEFEAVEDYVIAHGGYDRFDIFAKISN